MKVDMQREVAKRSCGLVTPEMVGHSESECCDFFFRLPKR